MYIATKYFDFMQLTFTLEKKLKYCYEHAASLWPRIPFPKIKIIRRNVVKAVVMSAHLDQSIVFEKFILDHLGHIEKALIFPMT